MRVRCMAGRRELLMVGVTGTTGRRRAGNWIAQALPASTPLRLLGTLGSEVRQLERSATRRPDSVWLQEDCAIS